jgi:glycosyltransferase Alg8
VVFGPRWVSNWLSMRFAQRRIAMQSHSLSNRVLTLTGRLSVIRARHALNPAFIELVEEDHLDHWLWGRFRFLSGDDKSTWFFLLRAGAKMIYVPDARVITIERFAGTGIGRMVQNLRRWSGNTLRSGGRGIALGPRIGVFIWWCLVDQRLAIWSTLVGPMLVLTGVAVTGSPWFFVGYIVWILATRLLLAAVLWLYAGEFNMSFPLLLYFNQILNTALKLICLVQLTKQRWTNRGDQRAGFSKGLLPAIRQFLAAYIVIAGLIALTVTVMSLTDRVFQPTLFTAETLLREMRELL